MCGEYLPYSSWWQESSKTIFVFSFISSIRPKAGIPMFPTNRASNPFSFNSW